jgi:threonine synthase
VVVTTSPSMDIQVSSNFERLLFEASARDSAAVRRYMAGLKQSGAFAIDADALAAIRGEFDAGRATMSETAATIRDTLKASSYLADPHTATAIHVAGLQGDRTVPMVVLGTAHPAKFPAAVEEASGVTPALPVWLDGLMERTEKYVTLPSALNMVEDHIGRHARAAR